LSEGPTVALTSYSLLAGWRAGVTPAPIS